MPRLFSLFRERKLPVSALINAAVCDDYPRLAERVAEAAWEVVGHGYWQRSLQSEGAEERRVIDRSLERLMRFFGVRPRGWLGPGLKESFDTPDHLKAAGIDYLCDWVIDDLPTWMDTQHGPLICMPYTLELNDSTLYAVQQHPSDALYERMRDSLVCFDRELTREPRILTLALHPHLVAVPHRMLYLERMIDELTRRADTIFMTGSAIADWFVEADATANAVEMQSAKSRPACPATREFEWTGLATSGTLLLLAAVPWAHTWRPDGPGGHRLTVIDPWGDHIEAIKRDGISMAGTQGEAIARLNALHIHEVQTLVRRPVDVAFIAMKSYDTEWATLLIKDYLSPSSYAVSLQNGINEERIAKHLGWGRTLGCIASTIGVSLVAPGHVVRTYQPGGAAYTIFRATN